MKCLFIDPGVGGGIVIDSDGELQAKQMPESIPEIADFFASHKDAVVVCEELRPMMGGRFKTNPKSAWVLSRNYHLILMACYVNGIPINLIPPKKWQAMLDTEIPTKYDERKAKFKELAALRFPTKKVTAWSADAYLLASLKTQILK
jgi:hypothetical protein